MSDTDDVADLNMLPRHEFLPEAPGPSFATVLLRALKAPLIAKRLQRDIKALPRRKVRDPRSQRYVWSRPRKHPTLVRAEWRCQAELLADLQNGHLVGFTVLGDLLHRIPAGFWREQFVGLSLDGTLFDIVEGQTFRREFLGRPIFILEECARRWLSLKKIDESYGSYPDSLRVRPHLHATKMPDDDQIIAKLKQLCSEGYERDEAVKRIRFIPGFERVGNAHARRVISGLLPRGRPRKKPLGN